ncbi:MAG: 1-acyl-sn-glycerol-3-phosphate acyltransferase [Deltaproteobacteria bacterium]|nr:1-acyl-sn-glycerol-3-phosphate acyltransferase [Deltaproteobacteria bacterium]
MADSPAKATGGRNPATLLWACGVVLMNAVVYPLLVAWTALSIVLSPVYLALATLPTRWPPDKAIRFLIWLYGRSWMALVLPFLRFRREGFTPDNCRRPSIVVVNHLSFFDTFFMGALPFFDVTFAVRSWPFKMVWFTYFMKLARYLDVERMTGEETFAAAREALERKGRILFFPEGHRSRDGKLHRFHTGAFRIAVATGVPIVPLCLTGTGDLLPPGRWWLAPARVRMRALPAVDPKAFTGPLAHRKLRDAVAAAMERAVEEMS